MLIILVMSVFMLMLMLTFLSMLCRRLRFMLALMLVLFLRWCCCWPVFNRTYSPTHDQDDKERRRRLEEEKARRMRKMAEVNSYNTARGATPREVCILCVCAYVYT